MKKFVIPKKFKWRNILMINIRVKLIKHWIFFWHWKCVIFTLKKFLSNSYFLKHDVVLSTNYFYLIIEWTMFVGIPNVNAFKVNSWYCRGNSLFVNFYSLYSNCSGRKEQKRGNQMIRKFIDSMGNLYKSDISIVYVGVRKCVEHSGL
jgi:hypothetical protein